MKREVIDKGVYYLTYTAKENPKRCRVGVKYPGMDATPFVVLGGNRAKDIFDFVMQLLENNGLKYFIVQDGDKKLIELPWATGLATTIYFLSVYSCVKPLKYASFLEKMITGRMPFMKHLISLTEFAISLSIYIEEKNDAPHRTNKMVNDQAAKVISKMFIELIKKIENAAE